jgi:hypothetical protein
MAGRILLCSLIALMAACTGNEPPILDQLGDPCRSAYDVCLDDDSVRSCEDGVWVERDCASVCAELGTAYGPAGCDRECVCELLDPSGCTPGEATCVDEGTVAVCDEVQQLQPTPCSEICADAGLHEVGCLTDEAGEASCWCTGEGTSCEASSAPACVDDGTIATCEAGTWTFFTCETVCGTPAACDPFRQPAACDC